MKSRRKVFVRLAVILGAASLLTALYLRVGIFPGSLRDDAIRKIGEWTGKRVTFERAVFVPLHGLSLTGVAVFEPDGRPILSARRITVNVRLLPFLREKKIVVNRLLIDGASYDWTMGASKKPEPAPPKTVISGQIEVPTADQAKTPDWKDIQYGPDFFLPENVYIERIEIGDGTVRVRKAGVAEPVETVRSIDMRLTMPNAPILRFEGRVELGDTPYASIDLTGAWDLKRDRYEFFLRTKSREVPGWLIDYQQGRFLILREAEFTLETKLFNGDNQMLLFNSKAELREATLKLYDARYSGHMKLRAEGAFDGRTKKFAKYKGELSLVNVDALQPSKTIERLDGISGKLHFEPDLLVVRTLRGSYKQIPFDASGTVRSFKELRVDGEIRTHLTMDKLRALLPAEHREKLKDFTITGDCEARTILSGSLRKDSKVQNEYKLVIQNGSVRNESKKIAWSGLSGEVWMGSKGVRLDNVLFSVNGAPHRLAAFIPKTKGDAGSLRFDSPAVGLRADYTASGEDLLLKSGEATFAGGSASFTGRAVRWSNPRLELKGSAHLDVAKLLAAGGKKNPALKGLNGRGLLSGPFTLSGAWNRPLEWDFKMDGSAGSLYWKERIRFDDVQLQIRMKDGLLAIPYIRAKVYGGTLGCQFAIGLREVQPRFEMQMNLHNVDLSRIGPDLTPSKPELKGTLLAKLHLEGVAADPSSWTGTGALSVSQGFLWQTDRFKQMGNLPLVKVEGLDWVTFQDMGATFEVRKNRIHTEDLSMFGDSVDLAMDGAIGFDGTLDLVMNIQYSEEVFEGASLTGGFVPLVVSQAGNFISQYHVSGTLKTPKYDKMILPSGRIMGKKLSGAVQNVVR
jgi:hypothetical protein